MGLSGAGPPGKAVPHSLRTSTRTGRGTSHQRMSVTGRQWLAGRLLLPATLLLLLLLPLLAAHEGLEGCQEGLGVHVSRWLSTSAAAARCCRRAIAAGRPHPAPLPRLCRTGQQGGGLRQGLLAAGSHAGEHAGIIKLELMLKEEGAGGWSRCCGSGVAGRQATW